MTVRLPALRPTGDPGQDTFQREVREALRGVTAAPFGPESVVLPGVVLGTSVTRVKHPLGRPWRRWALVDISADARVWRVAAQDTAPSVFLPLQASAAVTVSILLE